MPAIITHHLFGLDVYEKHVRLIGADEASRDAFLLGNIGPDPLFCLQALPSSIAYRQLGRTMHTEKPSELLANMHKCFFGSAGIGAGTTLGAIAANSPKFRACKAFALGFLCHYLLDSTVHPLVYAQQYAICKAGVAGLPKNRSGREVHAIIETTLDESLLRSKLGVTVASFEPHKETLNCPNDVLAAVSARVAHASKETYGMFVTSTAFMSSVLAYRTAQTALDAGHKSILRGVDYAKIAGNAYEYVKALMHRESTRESVPFANEDHAVWPHPFVEGEEFSASFSELYGSALAKAEEVLPRYGQEDFTLADCEKLTSGLNFYGRPC